MKQTIGRLGGASHHLMACAILAASVASQVPDLLAYDARTKMLTDLWDRRLSLEEVCGGRQTLMLVCAPGSTTCRQAAVHFDARSSRMKARGIQPVCVLIGRPEEVREAVLAMDIKVTVCIDAEGILPDALLAQQVLPALVLLDGAGTPVKIAYGAGETLEGNIASMVDLGTADRGRRGLWLLASLIPVAILGIIILLLG